MMEVFGIGIISNLVSLYNWWFLLLFVLVKVYHHEGISMSLKKHVLFVVVRGLGIIIACNSFVDLILILGLFLVLSVFVVGICDLSSSLISSLSFLLSLSLFLSFLLSLSLFLSLFLSLSWSLFLSLSWSLYLSSHGMVISVPEDINLVAKMPTYSWVMSAHS